MNKIKNEIFFSFAESETELKTKNRIECGIWQVADVLTKLELKKFAE